MQHSLHLASAHSISHTNVVPRAAPTPVSCVLLPGVDRRQLAENAEKLEAAAAAAHMAAQQLNKEGKYEVRHHSSCFFIELTATAFVISNFR